MKLSLNQKTNIGLAILVVAFSFYLKAVDNHYGRIDAAKYESMQ